MSDEKQNEYWIYILLCQNNSYYTGYTIDLEKRYTAHVNGSASKYTRSFKPIAIAQAWKIVGDKSLAMKVECCIKKLSRGEKEIIIAKPAELLSYLKFSIELNAVTLN